MLRILTNKVNLLVASLLFLLMNPVSLWNIPIIGTLFSILLGICLIVGKIRITRHNLLFFTLLVILYVYSGLVNGSYFGIVISVLLCCSSLVKEDFILDVFKSFQYIYVRVIAISIIVYILVLFGFGDYIPHREVAPLGSLKSYSYIHYPFLAFPDKFVNSLFYRFNACFDEPGVVGTFSGILIICNQYKKIGKDYYILLLSGLLSMSLAFFVLLFIHILLSGNAQRSIGLIFIVTLIVVAISTLTEIDIISQYLLERLEITDNSFSGNNRTSESFDRFYANYISTPKVLVGLGNFTSRTVNVGGASYKDLIVDNGIIFFISYCVTFIGYALKRIGFSKMFLLYTLIFTIVIYQRPFIYTAPYFLILIMSIVYIAKNNKMFRNN